MRVTQAHFSAEPTTSSADKQPTIPVQISGNLERLAYGITDAAFVSGISRSKIYELLNSGVLPSVKIGARRLIRARDLADLLDIGCG
jgi:excisionase family DNA binding protein